jgi:hypothetical protein
MARRVRVWAIVGAVWIGTVPGRAAAQSVDPVAAFRSSAPVRVVVAFLLVLLVGGLLLSRDEAFVDRAVDASMANPLVSLVYGVFAQGGIVFLGGYVWSQIARIGSAGALAGRVGAAFILLFSLALAGLGLTVVGAGITEAAGDRQLWPGLAIGATIGAAAWLAPTLASGLVVWVLLVGLGVGGPTRNWIHSR